MKRCHPSLVAPLFGLVIVWLWAHAAVASEPTEAATDRSAAHAKLVEQFEREVRPLFAERCYGCHDAEHGDANGGLVLDSVGGIRRGGSRGSLLEVANDEAMLLWRAVSYSDPDLQMPPEGRLSDKELLALRQWLEQGAALPAETDTAFPTDAAIDIAAAREFWSFRPLQRPPLPTSADHAWVRTPLDTFVSAQQRAQGLTATPPAERHTWLRRVAFDLTGLPPSIDLQHDYLTDLSPDADERLVDRLMATPQFGERWARVWLDLARYSDETPEWQSPTQAGWVYRDWVVAAFNASLPYDQFVQRQLAADLMPIAETDPQQLAALGFLGLSPTYWKELRLAPGVIQQIVADEWDERIDATMRTFLGLTVACARCHDHKFDPISSEDYYALAGVFASTQLDQRPLLPPDRLVNLQTARAQLASLEKQRAEVSESTSVEAQALDTRIATLRTAHPELELPQAHVVREASVYVEPDGEEMTKLVYREAESRDVPLYRRGNPLNPGELVPRRFLRVLSAQPSPTWTVGSGRRELARSVVDDAQALAARVIVNRIWDQYFRAGLVTTLSDFGSQGERPSHPELLEYLAAELVAHDWDLKWLHRQIALSATYRQASTHRADAYAVDPENRWLWRMSRRRLEVELWRDAMLASSDDLSLAMGGPSTPLDELTNDRRSLYVRIAREDLHPVLRMHDFPEASSHSPRREPTVTAQQQLFLLNSVWVEQQAERLDRELAAIDSTPQQIQAAYQRLLGRTASEEEVAIGMQYLAAGEPELLAARRLDYWQAMYCLNEFHYVD